jgi:hypothetical protein
MKETVFEGGCLCGAIRYRAAAPPMRAVICHCSICRKHTGAPIASFVHFPIDSFTWLKEQPKRYRSSEFAERGFCSRCGSTVAMHEEVLSDRVQVAIGSLDQPDRVAVNDHVWTQDQISWFDVRDDLPRFRQNSSAAPTKAI